MNKETMIAKADAYKDMADWAHGQIQGISMRSAILNVEAMKADTQEEKLNKLLEISELVGYARALRNMDERILKFMDKLVHK